MPRARVEPEAEAPAAPKIVQVLAAGPNDTHVAWGVLDDGTVRALARDGNRLVAIEDPAPPEEPEEVEASEETAEEAPSDEQQDEAE